MGFRLIRLTKIDFLIIIIVDVVRMDSFNGTDDHKFHIKVNAWPHTKDQTRKCPAEKLLRTSELREKQILSSNSVATIACGCGCYVNHT